MSRFDPTPAFARATLHVAVIVKLREVGNTALIVAPGFAAVLNDLRVAIAS